jgi:uncharacterized membrane protein (UPF0127 family)
MKIYLNKREISLNAKKTTFFGRFSGLMFKSKDTENLLFEFGPKEISTIHSFFVFFSFLAIWLDNKNNVLEWNLVSPFTPALTPKKSPRKLVEVPINSKNKKIINLFVDKKETFKYYRR